MTVSNLPRPKSFQDEIEATLKDSDPSDINDVASRLYDLHCAQVRPLHDQIRARNQELTELHSAHRRSAFMLGQAEGLAAGVTQQVTRHAAAIAHQNEILRKIKHLAQSSFDGRVSAEELTALMSEEVKPPTSHSIQLGFYPSDQFRGGVFKSWDAQVSVVYTFVGWVNVMAYVGGGVQTEPAFLVQDRGVLPASTIEMERELRLEMPLLPKLLSIA